MAFSGKVHDPDTSLDYTEVAMNDGLPESQVPSALASDAYQVLLVANKYQTGFDQPLLCAMYVDRKLSGVQAVQTLSRLNRIHPGKQTFVLDFVNEAEDVRAAFQPFYEQTTVAEQADPQQLDNLQHDLDQGRIWTESELDAFARVFYRPKRQLTEREHEAVYRHLAPAVDRWKHWDDEDARETWRGQLAAFVRLYAFLSQILPYGDRELEIRYSFGRLLLTLLPAGSRGDRVRIDGKVDIEYYRLARTGAGDIVLDKGQVGAVRGPTAVGTGKAADEEARLRDIIEILNERFGTDFKPSDRLLLDQIKEDGKADEQVQQRALANPFDNFALSFRDKVEGLMIDRMERNQELVSKYLNESDFKETVFEYVARHVYDEIRRESGLAE